MANMKNVKQTFLRKLVCNQLDTKNIYFET